MVPSDDPTDVEAIAVTAEDVVAALEAREQGDELVVLRATPPFSGRMRARLHVAGTVDYDDDPVPIHVSPADLVDDPPAYPTPDGTEDELRADPDVEYSMERHRERHEERLAEWRRAVQESVADSVVLDAPESHEVDVLVLGTVNG